MTGELGRHPARTVGEVGPSSASPASADGTSSPSVSARSRPRLKITARGAFHVGLLVLAYAAWFSLMHAQLGWGVFFFLLLLGAVKLSRIGG